MFSPRTFGPWLLALFLMASCDDEDPPPSSSECARRRAHVAELHVRRAAGSAIERVDAKAHAAAFAALGDECPEVQP